MWFSGLVGVTHNLCGSKTEENNGNYNSWYIKPFRNHFWKWSREGWRQQKTGPDEGPSRQEEIKPYLYPDGIHWRGNGRDEDKERAILSKRGEDPITKWANLGFWLALFKDRWSIRERDGVGTNGVLISSWESGWKWWMIEETVWNKPLGERDRYFSHAASGYVPTVMMNGIWTKTQGSVLWPNTFYCVKVHPGRRRIRCNQARMPAQMGWSGKDEGACVKEGCWRWWESTGWQCCCGWRWMEIDGRGNRKWDR